jgi:tetratricopeptide (TPR) repeat protein
MDERRSAEAIGRLHGALRAEQVGEVERSQELAEQALREFDAAGDPTGAAASRQLLASLLARWGRLADAANHLETALALRQRTGDLDGQGSLLDDLVGLHVQRGDLPSARAAATRLIAVRNAAGDREGEARAMHQLAQFLLQDRDLDAADRLCGQAQALLERPGDEPGRAAILVLQSRLALGRSDTDGALRIALQAKTVAAASSFQPVVLDATHHLATVHIARGDLEPGRRLLLEALDGRIQVRDDEGKAATLQELAAVETALGRVEDAVAHLGHAARTYAALGSAPGEMGSWHALAALCDEHGRFEAAIEAGSSLIAAAARHGDAADMAPAHLAQATRRVRCGDLLGAVADLRASMVHASETQGAAVARAMLGQVMYGLGDVAAGRAELEAARSDLAAVDPGAAEEIDAILVELEGH